MRFRIVMHYQRLLVGLAKFRWTRSENSGCAPIRHGPGHSIRHAAPSPGPAVTSGFDLSRARPACHFAAPEWCRRIPHAVAQESAGTPIDCDLNHSLDGVTTRRATAPISHPWQRSQLSPSSPGLASRPPPHTGSQQCRAAHRRSSCRRRCKYAARRRRCGFTIS